MGNGFRRTGLKWLLLTPCNETVPVRSRISLVFQGHVLLVLRLILAVVFIYAAVQKIGRPIAFADEIRMYGILDIGPLLYITAIALPWIELICGISLVTGVFIRGSALVLVILNLVFLVFVSIRTIDVMRSAGTPFTRIIFDCGCGFGITYAWKKLLEDLFFLLAAFLLVVAPSHRFAIHLARRS